MLRQLLPVLLLTISNIFMTFAWYGHLKYKGSALWIVILVSWGIALLEYCFQVPANRIGHEYFTAAQLKTMQEVITLIVFSVFSIFYLKEDFQWNYLVGFAFIILGSCVADYVRAIKLISFYSNVLAVAGIISA